MKPLQRAVPVPPPWTKFYAQMAKHGLTQEQAQIIYDDEFKAACWRNDLYVVLAKELPEGITHLSIRRNDRAACRDWRHFQQIKNQLCGAEREAVELYPAESRVVDCANQFHLWVLPEGMCVPLGYATGMRDFAQDNLLSCKQRAEDAP